MENLTLTQQNGLMEFLLLESESVLNQKLLTENGLYLMDQLMLFGLKT
jgi:hypothetical protein